MARIHAGTKPGSYNSFSASRIVKELLPTANCISIIGDYKSKAFSTHLVVQQIH